MFFSPLLANLPYSVVFSKKKIKPFPFEDFAGFFLARSDRLFFRRNAQISLQIFASWFLTIKRSPGEIYTAFPS